jgi:Flp pilus assembly protein TadG
MRSLAKLLGRRAKVLRRFGVAREGATMVEFALVAPAFLGMLIAIFETTIFLFAQQTLQNAAVEAGRMFLTGSAQASGLTQSQFNSDVCPTMVSSLFNCNNLQINVSTYASFSSASTSAPPLYDGSGNVLTAGTFSPGTPGQIMVVQLVYPWPIVGGPLGWVLPNTGYGTAVMMGTTAFKVEPY